MAGEKLDVSFTKYFRTSHVRIIWPPQFPYNYGLFLLDGQMKFEVTDQVARVIAIRGVRFDAVDVPQGERFVFAYNVEENLRNDGLVCVIALSSDLSSLGSDCIRVYDPEQLEYTAVVGPEGNTLKVGPLTVVFTRDKEKVILDGMAKFLEPSLSESVEVKIQRWGIRNSYSLEDTYDIDFPDGISLNSPALLMLNFDPNETGLPDDPSEYVLGKEDAALGFIPYSQQMITRSDEFESSYMLALADGFSPAGAKPSGQSSPCREGTEEEREYECCPNQLYMECDRHKDDPNTPDPCRDCCKCDIFDFLPSETCLCFCTSPEVSACGDGCEHHEADPFIDDCEEDVGCGDCTKAEHDDAKRGRRKRCKSDDCETVKNAVNDPNPKVRARVDCKCNQKMTSGSRSCFQEGDKWCCTSGNWSASPECTSIIPEWTNVPSQCQDHWDEVEQDLIDHECGHTDQTVPLCNQTASELSNLKVCGDTESGASRGLSEAIKSTLTTGGKRIEKAGKEYDDDPANWGTDLDCSCVP